MLTCLDIKPRPLLGRQVILLQPHEENGDVVGSWEFSLWCGTTLVEGIDPVPISPASSVH